MIISSGLLIIPFSRSFSSPQLPCAPASSRSFYADFLETSSHRLEQQTHPAEVEAPATKRLNPGLSPPHPALPASPMTEDEPVRPLPFSRRLFAGDASASGEVSTIGIEQRAPRRDAEMLRDNLEEMAETVRSLGRGVFCTLPGLDIDRSSPRLHWSIMLKHNSIMFSDSV